MAKVSIIIPIYNSSKTLRKCLDSVMNQTLDDIEIIIVDDASTDDSKKIVEEYQKRNPNIKYIKNEKNSGPGASRNKGLEIATGEYIGFLDSDDYIEKQMLKTMIDGALKNNKPDIVTAGIRFQNPKEEKEEFFWQEEIQGRITKNGKETIDIFFDSPSCCNKLFRKDFIEGEHFLENCMWEDFAFTFSMLIKADKILSYPQNFYVYQKDIQNGISKKGYQANSPLEDCFRIGKEIEHSAKKNHKYEQNKELVKMLQISACLERLEEIKEWPIEEEEKEKMMTWLYDETEKKYGSWHDVDKGLLSIRTNIFLLEKLEERIKENNPIRFTK